MNKTSEKSITEKFISFFKIFKSLILKNFGYKLLALFISLAVWAGLVSQAPNITREKRFENVAVSFIGYDSLKRNGFIVTSNFEEVPVYVNFSAEVPQMQYQNAKYTNFLPKIDLSSINKPGKITVPISTSNSSTYGEVTNISPSSVEIEVDTYITQYRIPVQYEKKGLYNDGYYCTEPYLDPMTIRVSGPARSVKNIAKAVVSVDVSKYPKKEGIIKTSSHFKLVDQTGKEIKDPMIEVTSDSVKINNIIITQHQYKMNTYNITPTNIVKGDVQEGYYIKNINISPSIVFVAGNSDLLQNMESIYSDESIDINNRKSSLLKNIRLNIPNEVIYASARSVMVEVDIEPVIKEKTFKKIPIHLIGKKDNYSYALDTKNIDIMLKDHINILNSIKESNIMIYVDVSKLTLGKHFVTLGVEISNNSLLSENFSYTVYPSSINLTVEEK